MTFLNTDIIRTASRLQFGVGGQDLINVMHFNLVSPSTLSDAEVLADIGEVLEEIYTEALPFIGLLIPFVDYTVKNASTPDAPQTANWPTLTAGTATGQAMPGQIAALILARTGVSRKQGRIFLPGGTEISAEGGTWSTAALAILADVAAELLLTHVATNGNYRYGVLSRDITPPPSLTNGWDEPISASVVVPPRTQRRRSVGFGS